MRAKKKRRYCTDAEAWMWLIISPKKPPAVVFQGSFGEHIDLI